MTKILDTASKFLGVVTAGVAIYVAIITQELNQKVNAIELERKRVDLVQDSIKFGRDFKMEIYRDIKEAMCDKDTIRHYIAKELVLNMMDDHQFKDALLRCIRNGTSSMTLKNKIEQHFALDALFQAQEDSLEASLKDNEHKTPSPISQNPTASRTEDNSTRMDVEVFYCEETMDKSKAKAEAILKTLEESGKFNVGHLRVLSSIRNSSPDYGIKASMIQYNVTDAVNEEPYALEIQRLINNKPHQVILKKITRFTPWYISVFVY